MFARRFWVVLKLGRVRRANLEDQMIVAKKFMDQPETIFQEKSSSTFLLAVQSMRVEDVNHNDRKKEHNWCDKADFKATIEDYADTIQTLTK